MLLLLNLFPYLKLKTLDFKNKLKDIISNTALPLTAEQAKMLTITGHNVTTEKRYQNFIREINDIIADKVKFQQFYYTVLIPMDLFNRREEIINEFKSRGFTIYTAKPDNKELFIISWKYE